MSAELDKIAKEFEARGFSLVARHIRLGSELAKNQGAPESFSVGTPELGRERERQVERYIELGFHKELE